MGNTLSFMDIYEKTEIASRNGDFLQVTYQMARFIRRCLDFKSMERGSLQSIELSSESLSSESLSGF